MNSIRPIDVEPLKPDPPRRPYRTLVLVILAVIIFGLVLNGAVGGDAATALIRLLISEAGDVAPAVEVIP